MSVVTIDFTTSNISSLAAALELAESGIPVLPCGPTKKPLTKHGFRDATVDPKAVSAAFTSHPTAFIGIRTGRESGIIAIDIDPLGRDWYRAHKGQLTDAYLYTSPRGMHLLFNMPPVDIRCSVGRIATGVDVRANGGYLIYWAAHGFEASGDLERLMPLPDWLFNVLLREESTEVVVGTADSERIPEGKRNATLTQFAGRMRAAGANRDELSAGLREFNKRCDPPMKTSEIEGIARSISSYPITKAAKASKYHEPIPLVRPIPPGQEFPREALGEILGGAMDTLVRHVQVPDGMAANCLLATTALAAQALANVETLGGDRPLSGFFVTVAASGDRKSSTDRVALAPVREHEKYLNIAYQAECNRQRQEREQTRKSKETGEAEDDGVSSDEEGDVADAHQTTPRRPWIISSDPTPEGLILSLKEGQHSQGIFNDEGAGFMGSHAMGKESELRTIALLSKLWQGDTIDRVRAKDREHITLHGKRLSLHLLLQPPVALMLLGNDLYRGQGFLSRCLISHPVSLAGTRLYDGGIPESEPKLRRYATAINRLLTQEIAEDPHVGGLLVRRLQLTASARDAIVRFYDSTEKKQNEGKSLAMVREFASKAAEHACRLAGILALIEDPAGTSISSEVMKRAIEIARYYLSEYRRLIGAAVVSAEVSDAEKLLHWLAAKDMSIFKVRDIMQRGPGHLRDADRARSALRKLEDHYWLERIDDVTFRVPDHVVPFLKKQEES